MISAGRTLTSAVLLKLTLSSTGASSGAVKLWPCSWTFQRYGFFPSVYYYQGRAREGMKARGYVDCFRKYLSIRGHSSQDPRSRT